MNSTNNKENTLRLLNLKNSVLKISEKIMFYDELFDMQDTECKTENDLENKRENDTLSKS